MTRRKGEDDGVVDRLLEAARRAALGREEAGAAVIDAADRDVNRALRRADADERRGLLLLLAQLGKRGRRFAERALARDAFRDDVLADLLAFLSERHEDHPIVVSWTALEAACDRDDPEAALAAFDQLPASLVRHWVGRHGAARMLTSGDVSAALMQARPAFVEPLLASLAPGIEPALLERLRQLAKATDDRALARSIRSTFFRLAQRGVEVPQLGSADETTAAAEPTPAGVAYLSAVDASGDQAVWIVEETEEGRHTVLQAVLDDRGAISAAEAMVLTRRGRDHLLEKLAGERAIPLASVAVETAIGLLEQAYALNPSTAGSEYRGWRQLSRADRRGRRPELPDVADEEASRLAQRSAGLLDLDACRTWFLDRDEAERVEKRMSDEAGSLVLPEAAERERASANLRSAAEEIWPPARRRRLVQRLRATALYLGARGDDEAARLAAATAHSLRSGEAAVLPLMERIIERSLEALAALREREAQGDGEGRLVGPDP